MSGFVGKIRVLALALGAPGLFIVAFMDSSFLSLPEIVDVLVVWMITQHKHRMLLYVGAATLGSLSGCLVMYYLGRKGGEALVRKHFSAPKIDRALAMFRRHGMLALLVPAVLPPPSPFKIFVVLAGVAGIGVNRFAIAIGVGRGIRYLVLGILAVEYGDRAMAFMSEHGAAMSLTVLGALGLGVAVYYLWTGRARREADKSRMMRPPD
jgi:membrane protein YqaA with SNARE-associated domain